MEDQATNHQTVVEILTDVQTKEVGSQPEINQSFVNEFLALRKELKTQAEEFVKFKQAVTDTFRSERIILR
jgi:hypothetical protein